MTTPARTGPAAGWDDPTLWSQPSVMRPYGRFSLANILLVLLPILMVVGGIVAHEMFLGPNPCGGASCIEDAP